MRNPDDILSSAPQPWPFGMGKNAEESNYSFARKDFPDRHFYQKNDRKFKQVACEETLDDWYAQSVGVQYEQLLKQKRVLRQAAKSTDPAGKTLDSHGHENRHMDAHGVHNHDHGQDHAHQHDHKHSHGHDHKHEKKAKKKRMKSAVNAHFHKINPIKEHKPHEGSCSGHDHGKKNTLSSLIKNLKKPQDIRNP